MERWLSLAWGHFYDNFSVSRLPDHSMSYQFKYNLPKEDCDDRFSQKMSPAAHLAQAKTENTPLEDSFLLFHFIGVSPFNSLALYGI